MNSTLEAILIGVIANVLCLTAVKIAPSFRGYRVTPSSPLLQLGILIGFFSLTMALVMGFSDTTDLPLDLNICNSKAMDFEKSVIDHSLSVLRVRWGSHKRPRQIIPSPNSQLQLSEGLPKVWRKDQQRYELNLREILWQVKEPLYVPWYLEIDLQAPDTGDLFVLVGTDIYYPAERVSAYRGIWTYRCYVGKPGIADFYDFRKGSLLNAPGDRFVDGRGHGSIAAIVITHMIGKIPVARSPFLIVVRKGIRDPDDVWLINDQPVGWNILSGQPVKCRIAFQSIGESGRNVDLFTCEPNGSKLRCLTSQFPDCYDGLFPEGSDLPPSKWISPDTIRFYSNRSKDGLRRAYKIKDKRGSKAVCLE